MEGEFLVMDNLEVAFTHELHIAFANTETLGVGDA